MKVTSFYHLLKEFIDDIKSFYINDLKYKYYYSYLSNFTGSTHFII
jgi:hypothetical protein